MSRLSALSALGLSMVLIGCGDDAPLSGLELPPHPVPGCEAINHTPCDVRQTACQTRLFALAACLRGGEPGELPPITQMTEAAFGAYLTDMLASRQPSPHLAEWERALNLLGLAQPDALSPATSVAEDAAFIWGWYRSDTKGILIVDHGESFNARSASIVLVHEFVHALQDREVDLDAFFHDHATNDDAALAARSVVEGEARMHEARYSASALGLNPAKIDWTQRFQSTVNWDEAYVLGAPSPYTATSRTFPYEWGARYLYLAWATGGQAAIRARFESPPATSRTLMASVDGPAAVDLPSEPVAVPVVPTGWTTLEETTLGAWGTFLFLAEHAGDPVRARGLSLGWRADTIWIYRDPVGPTAFVWRIAFGDADSAQAAAAIASLALGPRGIRQVGANLVIARGDSVQPMDWAFSF